MRRAGLIAAGSACVLAAAAAVWLVALRDTTAPVGVDDAVERFREDTTPGDSPVPAGVYVYATEGYEKTDALHGVAHRYPQRSTIAVAAADCGVRLTWRVLEGRSTEWTYCVTDEGWELRSQDERHTFFGRTERTTYVCEDTPIRRFDVDATFWNGSCGTGSTEEDVTVAMWGFEPQEVRGRLVETEHVSKESAFRGEIRGTARHDLWFEAESGVPVKVFMVSRTTTASPIGDVGYEERVTLTLLSLEPRR
ncbi:MAG TPA: hypothetical protein VFO64_09125 [Gaiellaceae bacterium]|nr:hypothetical protein [Gaiellaceae bacterium]